MELITFPDSITGIKIFPESYENDDKVFFHGTCEIYSEHIEQFGLVPNHKPLINYFYSIYDIASEVYFHTSEGNYTFNQTYLNAREYFCEFTRTSFSPVSLAAAEYSIGNMLGGQGLRHLINLKNELLAIDSSFFEDKLITICDFQKYFFENLESEINTLKNCDGVVYALKFDENDKKYLSYDNHLFHSVLLSFNHIPPSKIIGKMIIPNGTIFNQDLIKLAHEETKSLNNPQNTTVFLKSILAGNIKKNHLNELI